MASGAKPQNKMRVPPETVQKAITALLKWRRNNNPTSQKPDPLNNDDDEFVYLVLTLKKIPQKKGHVSPPQKIHLPHTLLSPLSESCLIIDDRSKSSFVTKNDAEKKIKAQNVAVSEVLKLSKLASDYRAFEAKRKLRDSFDVFFADRRVLPTLPRLLGRKFFDRKKALVPLDLKKGDWKEQVEAAFSSALFSIGSGTCSVVKVAKLSMEREEIAANVAAAIEGIVEAVPKKWRNVRSFHVKLLESLALPVYQAVPDSKLRIEEEKFEGGIVAENRKKKKKKEEEEIDEFRHMDNAGGEDDAANELGSGDEDDDGGGGGEDSEREKRKKGLRMQKTEKGVKKETCKRS